MDILRIVLRLIHIVSGVFWVGGSIILTFFISPTVQATAEAGQKFMMRLVNKGRITMRITIAAILTVLAGGALYWIDSGGLTLGWTYSATGWGFGIGAVFALIGLAFGMMVGKNVTLLGKLGSQIQGKPTTSDQLSQMQAAQKQLSFVGPANTIALIIALACMATARFW